MIEVLHNPRCSKSRAGIKYLDEKGIEYKIINYLKEPLSKEQLQEILKKLNMRPSELVRKKEKLFRELNLKEASEDEILEAMVENPKLIERPIVINGDKAVVARPETEIDKVL